MELYTMLGIESICEELAKATMLNTSICALLPLARTPNVFLLRQKHSGVRILPSHEKRQDLEALSFFVAGEEEHVPNFCRPRLAAA